MSRFQISLHTFTPQPSLPPHSQPSCPPHLQPPPPRYPGTHTASPSSTRRGLPFWLMGSHTVKVLPTDTSLSTKMSPGGGGEGGEAGDWRAGDVAGRTHDRVSKPCSLKACAQLGPGNDEGAWSTVAVKQITQKSHFGIIAQRLLNPPGGGPTLTPVGLHHHQPLR